MIKDSRSYEVQIIDAVRSVNRALGGTYGASSAIGKTEFNQYEVQLIDAIKGIGRTLSGKGLSLAGGGAANLSGYATVAQFQDLSRRVTILENESFFRLVDGNVTLKEAYQNLWVPGWFAAGGIGSEGGGGVSSLYDLDEVLDSTSPSTNDMFYFNGTKWTSIALKTINNNSLLGSGNITISGGGASYSAGTGLALSNNTFSLKVATASSIGGLKVNSVITTPSINAPSTTAGKYYYVQCDANGLAFVNVPWVAGSGGGGTLNEVGLSMPNCFSVSGSPLTSDGTISVSFASQTKNYVLAAPSSANGTPSFRALVSEDIPHQTIYKLTLNAGTFTAGEYTPNVSAKTFNIPTTLDHISDGTNRKLSDYVTLHTTQTIDGAKTFSTNPVTIDSSSGLSVHASSYIDIGDARLVYDSGSKALHVTMRSGTSQIIGFFADGFVSAGGVGGQSTAFVDLESNQTIGGNKTFTGITTLGDGISFSSDEINYGSRLYIQYNSNDLCLTKGGKTIIGTYPGSGAVGGNKLYVDGSAIATSWNTSSDARLKDDIAYLSRSDAVEKLMGLKPASWKWNSGLAKGHTATGFIAQEVEPVLPFMVTGEDYKGLAYQMLHAYEVSAIQSHEVRIRQLEKENDSLRREIERLKS